MPTNDPNAYTASLLNISKEQYENFMRKQSQLTTNAAGQVYRDELERDLLRNNGVLHDPKIGRVVFGPALGGPYQTSKATNPEPAPVPSSERDRIAAADIANASLLLITGKLRSMMSSKDSSAISWAVSNGVASMDLRALKSEAAKETLRASQEVLMGCAINCAVAMIQEHHSTILDSGIFVPEEWVDALIKAHDDGLLSMDVIPEEPGRAMRPINPP